jgi:hypothetical protein
MGMAGRHDNATPPPEVPGVVDIFQFFLSGVFAAPQAMPGSGTQQK